ncbi:hypothetical protein GCM10010156_73050 [Planobispora rosea]|uniref:Uncharacterized protein n=1 Tax=Planobispora rosea TaxID=35762 RepID=A0A8J3S7T7_PLARO|nr:hypothetical protein [Planobispora rosea]GGT04625.1 hypothetical protein GCM10010156_73050 [Planobispora rosea]GIH88883.1 hypothetical protein Pro02_72910 [Planobispora rosea]
MARRGVTTNLAVSVYFDDRTRTQEEAIDDLHQVLHDAQEAGHFAHHLIEIAFGGDHDPEPFIPAGAEEDDRKDGGREEDWTPQFERWRHGGWYVTNIRYPSGAVGCVSRNYPDGKWRIACDPRPDGHSHTYPTRDAAARAERDLVQGLPE